MTHIRYNVTHTRWCIVIEELKRHAMKDALTWKWYRYGIHAKYDCWCVQNLLTNKYILTSTEEACLKIIELAYTLKTGQEKPLNHKTLEEKARVLEGLAMNARRYWNWNGQTLAYDTSEYDD